jgi:hypothetical protein
MNIKKFIAGFVVAASILFSIGYISYMVAWFGWPALIGFCVAILIIVLINWAFRATFGSP